MWPPPFRAGPWGTSPPNPFPTFFPVIPSVVLVALGDITPKPFSHFSPCPWSIAEAFVPGLGPHLWLCLSSWDSGCCPRVSVAPYCWFDLQLPALAHSLPFLPPGVRGRAWETRSGLLSPCVTLGLLPTSTPSPEAKHNTGVGIQLALPEGLGSAWRKKLFPTLMAGIGNGEAALLHPKSLGMGGMC